MNNQQTTDRFLHLLKAAIWNSEVEAERFVGMDERAWRDLRRLAMEQSSLALVADKALTLPEEVLPPREMRVSLYTFIEQVKATNRMMTAVLLKVKENYDRQGYPFVLLKGLSNGLNYPQPLLRNPGDIDLLLYGEGDYHAAAEWLKAQGIETEVGDHIHYKYDRDGVDIENHHRITYFDYPKYDKQFREWEEQLFADGGFASVVLDGEEIQQLPHEMNAFFIFQHLFRHFVHFGVGLRQVCDWLLFLKRHREELDEASFTALIESYALLYPMQVFARAAIDHLGATKKIFPFPIIETNKHSEMVIKDLLDSGNFGFHRSGKQRPPSKYAGMWFSFTTTIKRSIKFGAISPEHIRVLPRKKLINRLRIGFKN